MSETEYHKGTLKKINTNGKTVKEYLLDFMTKNNIIPESDNDYDDVCSWWSETTWDLPEFRYKFFIRGETLYEMENIELTNDECTATVDAEGTIHYYLSYYNGGCSFQEALEEALDNNVLNMM